MQKPQMYLSQSLHRTQAFLTARAESVGPANSSEARRQLDTAIATMDAAVVEQQTSARELRGNEGRRRQLERELLKKYMTPLAKFARASLNGVPDFAALTRSAQGLNRDRLVTAARSMAAAAERYGAQIAQAKFPQNFLTQFKAAAEAVQGSLAVAAARRVARTGATKKIATAGVQGRRAIAALDAVVSHTILGDERLEREWRAAKRMRRAGTPDVVEVSEPSGTIITVRTPASPSGAEVKAAAA